MPLALDVVKCLPLLSLLMLSGCTARPSTSTTTASSRSEMPSSGEPTIRVLVIEGAGRFFLEVDGEYEIRQSNRVVTQGPRLPKTEISLSGTSNPRLMIGQLACPPTDIHIRPTESGSLRLHYEESGRTLRRRYLGELVLHVTSKRRGSPPKIDVVNVLGLESYLPGVLAGELYPHFHLEAYRVQAIAARTFALYQMVTIGRTRHFDLRASEGAQVYLGAVARSDNSKARRAVEETRGITCTWKSPIGEKIFCTYYSSACGGTTQDVSAYLDQAPIKPLTGGIPCSYCRIGGQSYRWDPIRMSKSEITRRLTRRFPEHTRLGTLRKIRPIARTRDGRPLSLELVGEDGRSATVHAYAFRLAMGGHRLRSNHFRIVDHGHEVEFRNGRGFGHGIGLCQWGAEAQARLGKTTSEILGFYYPGSHLRRAY